MKFSTIVPFAVLSAFAAAQEPTTTVFATIYDYVTVRSSSTITTPAPSATDAHLLLMAVDNSTSTEASSSAVASSSVPVISNTTAPATASAPSYNSSAIFKNATATRVVVKSTSVVTVCPTCSGSSVAGGSAAPAATEVQTTASEGGAAMNAAVPGALLGAALLAINLM
ncbi:hypothetical protein TRVA0_051S00452 [Trichomonascus vanleenenianus]|uniref:uncharacterized protein n=1 Tax=Trichomonascus vanleenenianus TaxID=2268995 RepID=UPI003EC9F58A